jgi:membrane fusion protein, heavy metal efflux system
MVQAQNDFLSAVAGVSKANSRVVLTEILDKQNRRLLETKATSLRDSQISEADLMQARSELRIAETTLEAARNRLRILGKTDDEITGFQQKGLISPETPIFSPIAGTVVQRKLGPGQYVSYTSTGAVDPVFTIGDLSTVWVVAYVRETEAPKVRVGQQIEFSVMAYPDQVFHATVNHVSASLDTGTRRLLVRATVDNSKMLFKPEMFASVTLYTSGANATVAVPRDAIIFEAGRARVWVVKADRSIEEKQVKTGLVSGALIEVVDGLSPGDKVVTKGSIFVDRAASS